MKSFSLRTPSKETLIDITPQVAEEISRSKLRSGLCFVYIPHTTAGVTINENADPSVRQDLLMALRRLVPDSLPYSHGEGNSPAHVKASLIGSSATVLVENGQLQLGTWQGIFFCEFDGPRTRRVFLKFISAAHIPDG